MTDALAKREVTGALAATSSGTINAENFLFPTLSIRQNSVRKQELKAYKPGDLVVSPTYKKVGDTENAVNIVPLQVDAFYKVTAPDLNGNKDKLVRFEKYVAGAPEHFQENSQVYKREQVYIGHVLFLDQLKKMVKMKEAVAKGEIVDTADFALPTRIIFSRRSKQAARILLSHFETSKIFNQTPAAFVFSLKTTETSNDKGSWFLLEAAKLVDPKEKFTPKDALDTCNQWVKILNVAKTFKAVDEDADEEETESVRPGATVETFDQAMKDTF